MTKYAPGKEQHKAKKSLGQNFLVDSSEQRNNSK
jgi:hypothetical protein